MNETDIHLKKTFLRVRGRRPKSYNAKVDLEEEKDERRMSARSRQPNQTGATFVIKIANAEMEKWCAEAKV